MSSIVRRRWKLQPSTNNGRLSDWSIVHDTCDYQQEMFILICIQFWRLNRFITLNSSNRRLHRAFIRAQTSGQCRSWSYGIATRNVKSHSMVCINCERTNEFFFFDFVVVTGTSFWNMELFTIFQIDCTTEWRCVICGCGFWRTLFGRSFSLLWLEWSTAMPMCSFSYVELDWLWPITDVW
jgi:hypothetical protein